MHASTVTRVVGVFVATSNSSMAAFNLFSNSLVFNICATLLWKQNEAINAQWKRIHHSFSCNNFSFIQGRLAVLESITPPVTLENSGWCYPKFVETKALTFNFLK
jgi:hypothetical protein